MGARKSAAARREVMGGLAKGLEVIRAFTRDRATLTLSEVAEVAGLPAATRAPLPCTRSRIWAT
jgi:hypothetical protein